MRRILLSKRRKTLLVAGLVILVGLGTYVGFFAYAVNDYNQTAYNLQAPNPEDFIPANGSLLYAMAMWYEQNIANFHMPEDMIMSTWFNSTQGGVPTSYAVDYDSAEWTGHYLMAEACRYAWNERNGNSAQCNDALANIQRALHGIDIILHVAPNGGMARYAWPIADYPGDPDHLADNFYRSTWNGTDYIYEDDTSRDMHNGVMMGLGLTFLLVNDTGIRTVAKTLVETLLDYLISHGWLYVDPNGDPNGTDLGPGFWVFGTSGIWTLAYLKVGALVNPEKYAALYRKCAIDLDYVHRGQFPQSTRMNVISEYFGLLLEWETLFPLILLENDTSLRNMFIEYIQRNVYDLTKYDRNAEFNMFWCAINNITQESSPNANVIGDIGDCLMRYYTAIQRFPGRGVNLDQPDLRNPTADRWTDFFDSEAGQVLYPFANSIFEFQNISKTALTPDLRPFCDYLWSYSPYLYESGKATTLESSGADFLAVYWPCLYFNILPPPASYSAAIIVNYPGA